MKTDELITALATDAKSVRPPIAHTLIAATVAGTAVAAVLFFMLMPVRPDMPEALASASFLFKWVFTLTLLVSMLVLSMRLSRPEPIPARYWLLLLLAPAVLAAGVATELIRLPASAWMPTLVGHNADVCVIAIPLLSALPLAVLLLAQRRGAPAQPALAGAVAGLTAIGIGATFYAVHCMDDSPLFVGTWYVAAAALVAIAGALLGRVVLRW